VYAGNLYGGVERMLATLASTPLDALDQAFALSFEGRLADELRRAGARLHLLGPVRASRPWTGLRARRRLSSVMRGDRPDVAVCHSSWAYGIFGPVARKHRVPLVFWLHDLVTGRTWADRLASRTRPDLAISTSRFVSGALDRLWADLPVELVHPPVAALGIDAAARHAVRAELGTPASDVVIVMASRLEPWKGHPMLLAALGSLRDLPGWTCWIAGGAARPAEATHLREMQAMAGRLGIASRVHFLGERADVPRLMTAADVLCQPNAAPEPFGISFVEAMYAGLPVVSTELGGAREVLAPSVGILVPPADVAALAHVLKDLIQQPSLRRRLGGAGPPRARELCEPQQQAERMRRALARVVGARG
jgi:glycosyltransferase involved in cell wall biosynthesis